MQAPLEVRSSRPRLVRQTAASAVSGGSVTGPCRWWKLRGSLRRQPRVSGVGGCRGGIADVAASSRRRQAAVTSTWQPVRQRAHQPARRCSNPPPPTEVADDVLTSPRRAALGRPSLLSPQPDQPVAAPGERAEPSSWRMRCCSSTRWPRCCWPGWWRCRRGRSATSSSSRTTTTRPTRPPTNTRRRSRSATTCAARSCCSRSGCCRRCCSWPRRHCSVLLPPAADWYGLASNVSAIWLVVGFGAVLLRTVQLFFLRDVQTGLVWFTKILTDPFHDVKLYYRAPLLLLRGELVGRRRARRTRVTPRVADRCGRLARITSRSTCRLIAASVSAGSCHHQPSSRIALRGGDEPVGDGRRSRRRCSCG